MVTIYQRPLTRTCLDCGVTLPPERRGYYCETHGRESPPSVEVTIVAGGECWLLIFACPWCPPRRGQPRTHIHGGGPLDEPPSFGHRMSHCHAKGAPGGYELIAASLPYGCLECAVETAQGVRCCSGCEPHAIFPEAR